MPQTSDRRGVGLDAETDAATGATRTTG